MGTGMDLSCLGLFHRDLITGVGVVRDALNTPKGRLSPKTKQCTGCWSQAGQKQAQPSRSH